MSLAVFGAVALVCMTVVTCTVIICATVLKVKGHEDAAE